MKLLVVNANLTPEVTEIVAREARHVASPGTEIVAATGRFGARIVGTRAENALAQHALLELMAEHGGGCDGALIGVSFDTGLAAARELMPVPVVGMTEAAALTACLLGGRFGMVIFERRSEALYRELIDGYGLGSRLGALRAIPASPADMLRDPAGVEAQLVAGALRLVEDDNVDVVLLTGAAMAGVPRRIQARVPVPVIDGVSCGTRLLEALARMRLPKPRAGSYARVPPRDVTGVSPALAALFKP